MQGRSGTRLENILIVPQTGPYINGSLEIYCRIQVLQIDATIVKWMPLFTCFEITLFSKMHQRHLVISQFTPSTEYSLSVLIIQISLWWITVALYLCQTINGIFHPINKYKYHNEFTTFNGRKEPEKKKNNLQSEWSRVEFLGILNIRVNGRRFNRWTIFRAGFSWFNGIGLCDCHMRTRRPLIAMRNCGPYHVVRT